MTARDEAGTPTIVAPDGSTVARRGAAAHAGDQRHASFNARPSATNSTSHPVGTGPRSSPGAAFTATFATGIDQHHSSGGSDPPRPLLPERAMARRDGSMKIAPAADRLTSRTS